MQIGFFQDNDRVKKSVINSTIFHDILNEMIGHKICGNIFNFLTVKNVWKLKLYYELKAYRNSERVTYRS